MAASVWDRREGPWLGGISDIAADTDADAARAEQYDLFEYVKRNNVTTYQTALMVEQLLNAPKPGAPQLRLDVDRLANKLAAHPAITSLVPDDLGTVSFWKATAESAITAFAASMLALLGAGVVDILAVPWTTDLRISGGVALVSVLKSLVASQVGDKGSPSFLKGGS